MYETEVSLSYEYVHVVVDDADGRCVELLVQGKLSPSCLTHMMRAMPSLQFTK